MSKPHWVKKNGIWFKFDSKDHLTEFVAFMGRGIPPANNPYMFTIGKGNACKQFVAKGYKYLRNRS